MTLLLEKDDVPNDPTTVKTFLTIYLQWRRCYRKKLMFLTIQLQWRRCYKHKTKFLMIRL